MPGYIASAIGGSAILNYLAAGDAADTTAGAANYAADLQSQQYNQTRQDMMPFLQAATGQPVYENLSINDPRAQDFIDGRQIKGLEGDDLENATVQVQTGTQGGALNQFMEQYNQAPTFQFDPSGMADDPYYQQQLQNNQQALDRINAATGRLGSGSRILDEVNMQNNLLGDYYNRELQQYGLDLDNFNSQINRLAGLVDVGRGAGQGLAAAGAQSAANAGALINQAGQAQAAGQLGQANAISGTLNNFIGAYGAGMFNGSPYGGTAGNVPSYGVSTSEYLTNPNIY